MERWNGKVAVVTGASHGIGEAVLKTLAKSGLIVIGLARNEDKLKTISTTSKGKIHVMKCDLKHERNILAVFRKIEEEFGGVDILINNAAVGDTTSMIDGSTSSWKDSLDTNVLGLSICTREALKSMKTKNDSGHIIHMNSILGHVIPPHKGMIGIYPACKYAVTALADLHRSELRTIGSKIKVTSLSPGWVFTQLGITGVKHLFNLEDFKENEVPEGFLSPQDVADAVISILSLQPHVEIKELTLMSNSSMSTSMPQ